MLDPGVRRSDFLNEAKAEERVLGGQSPRRDLSRSGLNWLPFIFEHAKLVFGDCRTDVGVHSNLEPGFLRGPAQRGHCPKL